MSHSHLFRTSRRAAVLALTLFASLLSCGREITGPGGRGAIARVAFAPDYSSMIDEVDGVMHSVADLVPFTKVRIELRRVDNSVAATQEVTFPENATEVPLSMTVQLGEAAEDGGEVLTAFLRYINASGDTVFAGGPQSVTVRALPVGTQPEPVEIPIFPTVPGGVYARLELAPDTLIATMGQNANLTATGFDAQDVVVPNAIVGFISRNSALVTVPNLGSGTVTLNNLRGSTWVIAQSLTGLKDSVFIQVLPRPSAMDKIGGDAQSAITATQFAQPIRVRLRAPDNGTVPNWPVNFAITTGGGSLSALVDTTDANGEAEVLWTAGATAGAASVTASVPAPAVSVVFTGTQVSTDPTSLVFQTQPTNITAGDTLPTILVAVRNGLNQTASGFTGAVTLSLSGGTAGAALVGTTTVNAVAGIASFSGLTVNKGGTNYRLLATYDQLTPPQSNTFNATAAPPAAISVLGGAGQVVPPSTELPDSVRVRVTDAFGFPAADAPVLFTVLQGGGSVTAVTGTTDADGRAGVKWTVGLTGLQQLRVRAGSIDQFVTAGIVSGTEVTLFAGYDYTQLPVGGTKSIPLFLTNPSAGPVVVTLGTHAAGASVIQWSVPTAQFNAGQTRIDVPINGIGVGSAWAIITSAAGPDSLLVTVDSSTVDFVATDEASFSVGDTVRTHVRLSEPAPAGGRYVTVRSANPAVAIVAPSSGSGAPLSGCVGEGCATVGTELREVATSVSLTEAPADTAAIFIPEGQVFGEFAIVLLSDLGGSATVELSVESDGSIGSTRSISVQPKSFTSYYYDSYNLPAGGIGVGQQTRFALYLNGNRATADLRVQIESSRPDRVTVDSVAIIPRGEFYSSPVSLQAVGLDSAWIRYSYRGQVLDSLLVLGDTATLQVYSNNSYLAEGGVGEMQVAVGSLTNVGTAFRRSTPLEVTVTSLTPAVVRLDRSTLRLTSDAEFATASFRMVGPGAGLILVSAAGHQSDTLFVQTYTPTVDHGIGNSVGVGLLLDIDLSLPAEAVASGTRTLSVQSLSPSIASVLTPTVEVTPSNPSVKIWVRGDAVGAATVRVTGSGISSTDILVSVSPTQLGFGGADTLFADFVERSTYAYLWDGSTARAPADTVSAVMRSSNPAVLQVTDSIVLITPSDFASVDGRFRPVGAGSAELWLVSPGLDSVSSGMFTVQAFALEREGALVLSENLQEYITLTRRGPDSLALPLTVQHAGSGLVSFPELPTQFEVGQSTISIRMVGQVVGDDTVTFSLPGYAPITSTFAVQPTSLGFATDGPPPTARLSGQRVRNTFLVGAGATAAAGKPMRFVLRSLDTTRVVVEQDTIKWEVGDELPTQFATVKYLASGVASLSITDASGELPGDTLQISIDPAYLLGSSYYGNNAFSIGMGQRTQPEELYIQRATTSPEPLWVQLTSSNPAVVQVPDSIQIGAGQFYQYLSVTAGDTTGSARVTASATGYNTWHFDVLVTRAAFGLHTTDIPSGGRSTIEVFAVDAVNRTMRPFASPLAAAFRSPDGTRLDATNSAFVMPANAPSAFVKSPIGVTPGLGTLEVYDNRVTAFDSVLTGIQIATVVEARLKGLASRVFLTPGLVSEGGDLQFSNNSGRDSTWVRLARVDTRFGVGNAGVATDSLLIQSNGDFSYALRGLALGSDTLVLSAAGMVPDTVIVSVEPGVLKLANTSLPNIFVGDSLLIEISLLDAKGAQAMAAESIALSVSADTTFTVPGTVTINPGATSVQFWVRADQANQSSVSITSAAFRPLTLNLNAVNRP